MVSEHPILQAVAAAKQDPQQADALIREYLPFIRAQASKCLGRPCAPEEDAHSVAMMAFHEAIGSYQPGRGAFLPYAALCIRSRIADHLRKEARHTGHLSLHTEMEEGGRTLGDTLADERDIHEERATLQATRAEIAELQQVMSAFGVSFRDVAENSPKQGRTLEACAAAIRFGAATPQLLDTLLRTKKLPIAELALGTGIPRKTLERHRKYMLAMLLIQTNGYEIIRGHLQRMLNRTKQTEQTTKEGAAL